VALRIGKTGGACDRGARRLNSLPRRREFRSVAACAEPDDLDGKGLRHFYAAWGGSPTLRRIWREHVTGEDYPELFEHISFLSLDELRSLSERLELSEGDLLVTWRCGAGGPGLWVAKESAPNSWGWTCPHSRRARLGTCEGARDERHGSVSARDVRGDRAR